MNDIKHPVDINEKEIFSNFPALIDRYQNMVFNTSYIFLRNREDAEDIAQEVFIEIYRSLNSFRGESSLSTWIYRITVNRCMDYVRMKSRKKRNLFAFKSYGNEDIEKFRILSDQNPEDIIEGKEKQKIIQSAINKLPERQKVAFTLAKVEGLKQDKVAEIMDTTVGSVESLLIRAKKSLKQNLVKHLKELMD